MASVFRFETNTYEWQKAPRVCKCGHLDDPALACARAPRCAQDYQSKISGPLFDRIDLHVDVPAVKAADLDRAVTVARLHVAEALSYRRIAPGR